MSEDEDSMMNQTESQTTSLPLSPAALRLRHWLFVNKNLSSASEWIQNLSFYPPYSNPSSTPLTSEHLYLIYLWTYVTPILFSIIILIGIVGNSLVIYTISSSKVKRTSTNILLLNLAITDILFLLVCVPFKAHKYAASDWALGDAMCMWVQYLAYVTTYVTVWSLVAVSVIRFVSVVYANSSVKVRLKQNVIIVIILIWLLSLCANIPSMLAHTTKSIGSYTYCGMHVHATEGVFLSFFTFAYVLPLLAISVMYILILLYLNHHTSTTSSAAEATSTTSSVTDNAALAHTRNRKHKVFKIVLVVVLVFAVSWLPFHVNILLGLFGRVPAGLPYEALRIVWDCLAYSNSCVNPIIYNYASRDFRTAFKQVICGGRRRCRGMRDGTREMRRDGGEDNENRSGGGNGTDMTHLHIHLLHAPSSRSHVGWTEA